MLPTILAVPGAWHTAESFATIKKIFVARNYDFISLDPPGVLVDHAPDASAEGDAASLRSNGLWPLVDAGKDVVLLMHSYGGVYGSCAVKGLSKRERRQAGKNGGVIALIYISAVTPMVGKSTLDMMGTDVEHLPSWVSHNKSTGFVDFTGAKEVMYHDIQEDDLGHCLSLLRSQSLNCLNTPVSYSPLDDPNFRGTAGYIICGADRVIPVAGQETYAAIGSIDHCVVVEDASHAFFITAPEKIVDAVISMVSSS
ncbi:hypothetical protein NM208_g3408 [Fusarium decemcellulare]|uniref:Uncharacterized protein n=1 Tax=Fusarium decemcellulare TaxID=57161 RepID=A0ACC1SPC3_9HYPO|nr:hypothetical protein NM208_g3408 [Fusarium decemcellulare]